MQSARPSLHAFLLAVSLVSCTRETADESPKPDQNLKAEQENGLARVDAFEREAFSAIWGSADDDVWALGNESDPNVNHVPTCAVEVAQRAVGHHPASRGQRLGAVQSLPVGLVHNSSGIVLHYDGSAWTRQDFGTIAYLRTL